MPNGMYFQAYLNELGQRRQVEAHEFATQQMINQQVIGTIGSTLQSIGQQVHDQKVKEGNFKYQAEATGLFNPADYQVKTPQETQLEQQLAVQKGKADALKDQMVKQMQATNQPLGPVQQQQQPGPVQGEVVNTDYTGTPQNIKMNLNQRLQALTQEYQKTADNSNLVAKNLQEYKDSPQYKDDIKNAAFQQFRGTGPLDYSDVYKRVSSTYDQMLEAEKLKAKYETQYQAEYQAKQEFGQTPGQKPANPQPVRENALKDIDKAEKESNVINILKIANPDRYNEYQSKLNQVISAINHETDNTRINDLSQQAKTLIDEYSDISKAKPQKGQKNQKQVKITPQQQIEEDKKMQALADQFKK
jgi:hypothetical protein